jgi:hypothetical protein
MFRVHVPALQLYAILEWRLAQGETCPNLQAQVHTVYVSDIVLA